MTTKDTSTPAANQTQSRKDDTRDAGVNLSGYVFSGNVLCYLKGNEQFKVQVDKHGTDKEVDCVWAAGFMSELLGFNHNYAPPIGSEVIVFTPNEERGYILGCAPSPVYNDLYGVARKGTGGGRNEKSNTYYNEQKYFTHLREAWHKGAKPLEGANQHNQGGSPPCDMVEGEIDMTNLMGVGLQMMRHFSILKGGEFAKVEACLIDDMVRIISHTFRHFSSFGDYKIYNDGGRLNVVWDGTTCDWESWGYDKPDEPRSAKEEGVEGGSIVVTEKERLKNEAKWRFSSYVGFLGDFINLFVTDQLKVKPGEEEHMLRSGKGRLHVNEDGSVLVQSVNDIVLERVCRIPVPLQLLREDHPDGDGHLTNGELPFPSDDAPIKSWDWSGGGGEDGDKTFWCVYQLRDYGRWLSNFYSKARFIQLTNDWKVPPEMDVPEPFKKDSEEIDKRKANKDIPVDIAEVYSTIRMYRDGSISVSDGYENSIVLSKTGVTVSSSTNLQLEAAGSVNVVAGRDFNVVARNSADISAVKGGVSIRGENFIQQFSKGGILIESDGRMTAPSVWSTDDMDNPDANQIDPTKVGGIVIWSKNSSMRLLSKFDMGLRCEYGTQFFYGMRQFWRCRNIMSFNEQLVLTGGVAFLKGIMWCDQALIPKLYIDNDYKSIFDHPGHIIGGNNQERIKGPPDEVFERIETMMDGFVKRKWKTKFKYRSKEEYGTESDDPKSNQSVYESLTQQGLRLQAQNFKLKPDDAYIQWKPALDGKLDDRGTPWPGEQKQHFVMPFPFGDYQLWFPSGKTHFDNFGASLELQPLTLKRLVP